MTQPSLRAGICLAAGFALAACSGRPSPAPAAAPAESVATVVVAAATAAQELRFDGIVEAERQTTLAAQTAGRVVELPADVGDHVGQGALLVRLTATEQHAQAGSAAATLAEAEAREREAALQYTRIHDLFERRLVAKAQDDAARADADAARARAEAARGQLAQAREQAGYTAVRAPYDGIVVRREVELGEAVGVGRPLITMLAPEALRVAAEIPQQAMATLRGAREVRVILPDGRSLAAGALRIPPGASDATRSYRVLAALPDDGAAPAPGTRVKLAFAGGERRQIAVPQTALVHRAELDAVYVVDEHQRLSLRYVRIGEPGADGRVPVHAGLEAGERVALDPLAAAAAYRRQLEAPGA